ncbi:hypothetical protein DMENIID0001_112170 [Sergentomyia squamirostris]
MGVSYYPEAVYVNSASVCPSLKPSGTLGLKSRWDLRKAVLGFRVPDQVIPSLISIPLPIPTLGPWDNSKPLSSVQKTLRATELPECVLWPNMCQVSPPSCKVVVSF